MLHQSHPMLASRSYSPYAPSPAGSDVFGSTQTGAVVQVPLCDACLGARHEAEASVGELYEEPDPLMPPGFDSHGNYTGDYANYGSPPDMLNRAIDHGLLPYLAEPVRPALSPSALLMIGVGAWWLLKHLFK